jgi:recombination protein RecT
MSDIQKRSSAQDIKSLLTGDKFKGEVARALPTHLKPERFIRIACTALTKTPKLMGCTPQSFFNSLLTLSQLGIEPDGRRAHLIPYGTECQLIIDYKGIVELVMRNGNVSNIHADVVCEHDAFEYDKGDIKTHKIDFRKPRGDMYAVYAICRFKDGTEKTEVMTKDDVDGIRGRSKAGKAGPWVTDYNEMAKKTVFRRLSKWLTLSPEQRDALEKDDDQFPDAINAQFTDTPPEKGVDAVAKKLKKDKVVEAEAVEQPTEQEQETEKPVDPATEASPEDAEKAAVLEKVEKLKPYKAMTVKKYLQQAGAESLKDLGLDALNELHGQLTSA